MKNIIYIAFLLLALQSTAIAKGGLSAKKIAYVAFQTGGFFIYAEGGSWSNPNNCSRSNAIVLLASDPNYDKAYSLILSAFMAGKSVSGYSDGCATFDGQTYNKIRGFKYLTVR